MTDTAELLMQLGFSKTEASAYEALVRHGKMNGYQLAKSLGITRPAAYDALESLLAKGHVHLLQGTSREFAPRDPADLFASIKKSFCSAADTAAEELVRAADRSHEKLFANIEGFDRITGKVEAMIASAEKEILISGDFPVAKLASGIRSAAERGVRVIVFSFIDQGLGDLPVELYSPKNEDNPECMDRRIMLVTDFRRSLIANAQGGEWAGTFSENTLLSRIVSEHIHHDIYFFKLGLKHKRRVIEDSMLLSTLMETERT